MKQFLFFAQFFALISFYLIAPVRAQDALWGMQGGGAMDDEGKKIAKDSKGNIYVLGTFTGVAKFRNIQVTSKGKSDVFLAKYDWSGKLIWLKTIGGTAEDVAAALVVDSKDNIYISGIYYSDVVVGKLSCAFLGISDSYLAKLNTNGVYLWSKKIVGPGIESISTIALDPTETRLTLGCFLSDGAQMDWASFYSGSNDNYSGSILRYDVTDGYLKDIYSFKGGYLFRFNIRGIKYDLLGNLFVTGNYISSIFLGGDKYLSSGSTSVYQLLVLKLDSLNNILWAKQYGSNQKDDEAIGMDLDQKGNLYIAGYVNDNYSMDGIDLYAVYGNIFIAKMDTSGTVKWVKNGGGNATIKSIKADSAGNTFLSGYTEKYTTLIAGNGMYLTKINTEGRPVWTYKPGDEGNPNYQASIHDAVLDKNGNCWITGKFSCLQGYPKCYPVGMNTLNSPNATDMFLVALTDTSFISANENIVSGNVFGDLNNNCKTDATDENLDNYIVRADPGPYYGISKTDGKYRIKIPTVGSFKISTTIPDEDTVFVKPACSAPKTVDFQSLGTKAFANFGYIMKSCYQLTADVTGSRLRRCEKNFTRVNYCNNGTSVAKDVKIEVSYPDLVLPLSSSIPWTSNVNHVITYKFPYIFSGACGMIDIVDSVKCIDDITGLTQCTEVNITPGSGCVRVDARYDKSVITVSGKCSPAGDKKFVIKNRGENMADSSTFRVFFDNVLGHVGKFKLQSVDSLTFSIPATHAIYTIRLEADQSPNYPYDDHPVVELQYCSERNKSYSENQVNRQYLNEKKPDADISCRQIVDSFDPNDKASSPQGTGVEHNILPFEQIEYLVRFENTGTDTAYAIIVRDTLDAMVDLSTLSELRSSHKFILEVSGKERPVLTWKFYGINLVDTKTNPLKSQGFLRYSIGLKKEVAIGTVVSNKAFIYFDYNKPVITNEVYHTVSNLVDRDNSLGAFINFKEVVTSVQKASGLHEVNIYPNPSNKDFIVESQKVGIERLMVSDVMGLEIINRDNIQNTFVKVNMAEQASDVYYLKIYLSDGRVLVEKVVKH